MTATPPSNPARAADETSADTSADDFTYDAFISYSGFRKPGETLEFDRKVAERLHRSLEAYRVPRALTKRTHGRGSVPRRLKKIFRDRDEVHADSSLNHILTEALRRSRFLLVICSPRARHSQWMNQEIEIFRGLGRGEQILPLLIEGEPAEAFPEELFGAESGTEARGQGAWLAQPLAADIRAPTVSKSLRLLKDEKLRLLAPILGCEYDDLRRREHERFVRRAAGAGAAMLAGLLVLTALSLQLYFARQGESRNRRLALSTLTSLLPLAGLDPSSYAFMNDPSFREVKASAAIDNLEAIRQDDPENPDCLKTLRAFYGARSKLLRDRGREAEARNDFEKARSLIIPIALSRLRAWQPTEPRHDKESPGETRAFTSDHDLTNQRNQLSLMERPEGTADAKSAVEYSELVAEYLPLLDTSTREGKAEARRVLLSNLSQFRQARALAALTPAEEELVGALLAALARLPSE
ncbi:MAG: toll/interleukin-1 receptor domain-containing protein [Pyrinomonadaceae bacterium]